MNFVRTVGAALLLVLVTACATGTGGGFSREASRERSARNQTQPSPAQPSSPTPSPSPSPFPTSGNSSQEQAPQPPPSPTITINASPPQARISLNGRFLGTSSATFESSGFGQSVTVKVEATSYRTQTLTFSLWGQRDTVEVDLVPITGILEVFGTELEGAALSVDGQGLHQGANRVLIGSHTVRADRFGFVGQRREVFLSEDQTTTVQFDLLPAPFEFSALRSDRPEGFNPESAAIAATATLSFRVSAPGHARLWVSDSKGKVLETWDFPRLSTWDQSVTWSGRDKNGEPLPDGAYELTLAGGPDELDTVKSTGVVRIDRAFVDHDRPSLGPAAGLLWVPTAEVLSAGTVQWSMLGLGHNDGAVLHAPLSTAVRFSPARDWEWFGQLTARLWSDPYLNSGYATLSLKHRFDVDSPGFRAAWLVGATAATWLEGDAGVPPTDFLTTFPALKASLPISWSWGRWTLLLAPEVDLSFWSPSSAYVAAGAEEGLRAWAYGRAGLLFDPGPFSIGVSAAARTLSFDRGIGVLDPAQLGLEAHWPVADSALTITGYLSVSAYSTVDYAWYGGLGISLLLPPSITLDLASQLAKSP